MSTLLGAWYRLIFFIVILTIEYINIFDALYSGSQVLYSEKEHLFRIFER
jgi:hypothetical protein